MLKNGLIFQRCRTRLTLLTLCPFMDTVIVSNKDDSKAQWDSEVSDKPYD